jgi:hypothetical protein
VSTPTTPNEQLLARVQAEVSARRDRRREEQRALNLRAQSSLADLGYDIGAIDGAIGPRSRRALSAWLRTVGRPDTSAVDEALVASLETAVAEKLDAAADREDAPEPADALLVPGDAPPASLAEPPPSPRQPADSLTTNGPRQPIATAPIANEPPALSTSNPVPARGCSTPVAKAPEEERLALVIGNSNYRHVTPLRNPRADAEDMAKALCDLGFEIIDGYDLDRTAMDDRTSEFARRAQTADLAFVYYSGHGLQFEGRNYLVPIDGRLEDRHDLRRMVELDLLTEDTSAAKKAILVVDACRNDPTRDGSLTRALGVESRSIAGVGPGLALPNLNPGSRTLVAFAARPGSVAFDSKAGSRNSPYVEALLQRIKTPDVDVEQMLGRVQDDVAKATGNAQQPSFVSMLGGDQVLLVATPPTSSGVALSDMTSGERRAIQNSLKWLGFWPYPVDGQMSPLLEGQLRSVQRVRGDEDTGLLTPAQAVALHRRAAFERPPYPLPFETRDAYLRSLRGDIEAIRQMGMVRDPEFVAATGYRKDPGQAAELYEIAATSGDSLAAGRLGLLLSQPGSSENDLTKARNWLERAAAAGDPQAALRLAEILLDGPDAEAHRDEAAKLLGVARTDADTDGIAVALLRSLGMPIVQ